MLVNRQDIHFYQKPGDMSNKTRGLARRHTFRQGNQMTRGTGLKKRHDIDGSGEQLIYSTKTAGSHNMQHYGRQDEHNYFPGNARGSIIQRFQLQEFSGTILSSRAESEEVRRRKESNQHGTEGGQQADGTAE